MQCQMNIRGRRCPASEEEEPWVENGRRPTTTTTTTTGRRGSSSVGAAVSGRRTILRWLPLTAAPIRVGIGIVLAVLPGDALGWKPAVAARA